MTTENKQLPATTQRQSPLVMLGNRFNIEPTKLMEVLRGTVIKPDRSGKAATNEEVAAFCIVANQYGLNPFTREIHAFSSGDKGIVPIVGIDGWTHIVNAQDAFDGCEFEEINAEDGGKAISCTCKMYKKNMTRPVSVTEYYAECYRNTGPWNQMPHRMLRHKAYMQAARYAFGLSGIYDEDEARDIVANARVIEQTPIEMPKLIEEKPVETAEPATTTEQPADAPGATTLPEMVEYVKGLEESLGKAKGPIKRAKTEAKIDGDVGAVKDIEVLKFYANFLKAEGAK